MDIDKAIAVLPLLMKLDAKFHPLLKRMIADNLFTGPLAKFAPFAAEIDAVLDFLEQMASLVLPTA